MTGRHAGPIDADNLHPVVPAQHVFSMIAKRRHARPSSPELRRISAQRTRQTGSDQRDDGPSDATWTSDHSSLGVEMGESVAATNSIA